HRADRHRHRPLGDADAGRAPGPPGASHATATIRDRDGGGDGGMTATGRPSAAAPEIRQAASELGTAFKGLMGAFRRLRGRETRHPHGLSDAQYTLLFGLRDHQALPSRELAGLADLSPATTTEMLDGLAQAGLVTRVRSEQDRRVVLTSLTEHGQALLEER